MWRGIFTFVLVLAAAHLAALENRDSTDTPFVSRSLGIGVGVGTLSLVALQVDLSLDSHAYEVSATYLPGATPAFSSYAVRAAYRQTLLRLDQWAFGAGLGLGWQHFLTDSLAIPHPFNEKAILAPTLFASWSGIKVELGPALGYRDSPSLGLALELSYRFPILPFQE